MPNFPDKRILVTGGSRGIGLGLARFFNGHEAKVAICGRKEANLAKAREELGPGADGGGPFGKVDEVEHC